MADLPGTQDLIIQATVTGDAVNTATFEDSVDIGTNNQMINDAEGIILDAERPRFIGFRPVDRGQRLCAGAHFIPAGRPALAEHDEGYMTSVAYSPELGHWIGLGLLRRGPARIGERIRALDLVRDSDVEVEVCSPAFIDPAEERLRV